VVSGCDDDFDVVGDLFDVFGCESVLFVYVFYGEFFLLVGVYADAVDDVACDEYVFYVGCDVAHVVVAVFEVEPEYESVEGFFGE